MECCRRKRRCIADISLSHFLSLSLSLFSLISSLSISFVSSFFLISSSHPPSLSFYQSLYIYLMKCESHPVQKATKRKTSPGRFGRVEEQCGVNAALTREITLLVYQRKGYCADSKKARRKGRKKCEKQSCLFVNRGKRRKKICKYSNIQIQLGYITFA